MWRGSATVVFLVEQTVPQASMVSTITYHNTYRLTINIKIFAKLKLLSLLLALFPFLFICPFLPCVIQLEYIHIYILRFTIHVNYLEKVYRHCYFLHSFSWF